MQPANATTHNGERHCLRGKRAGLFAAQIANARAERLPAMRMRMHAEQAEAAAAALR